MEKETEDHLLPGSSFQVLSLEALYRDGQMTWYKLKGWDGSLTERQAVWCTMEALIFDRSSDLLKPPWGQSLQITYVRDYLATYHTDRLIFSFLSLSHSLLYISSSLFLCNSFSLSPTLSPFLFSAISSLTPSLSIAITLLCTNACKPWKHFKMNRNSMDFQYCIICGGWQSSFLYNKRCRSMSVRATSM